MELREKVARLLWKKKHPQVLVKVCFDEIQSPSVRWTRYWKKQREIAFTQADSILALIKQEYVRLDKEQELPRKDDIESYIYYLAYETAQTDMLSAGWKKIEGE